MDKFLVPLALVWTKASLTSIPGIKEIEEMMMTNTLLLRLATVLMLFSIHTVQAAQIINTHVTNTTSNSRYIVHEPYTDGTRTVTDTVTGLVWQQCSVGQSGTDCSVGTASTHTWEEALKLAASANEAGTGGYSNWRLPNIRELQSIVAEDRYNPNINSVVFPNTPSAYYWSSSPYVSAADNSGGAWVVSFSNGRDGSGGRSSYFSVRLVGSGQ